jgi:CheY-like chemotaxis protein
MKTVLIIEDNEDILDNTTEILELANFKAVAARNGREGIDMALKSNPDIILCDIMMPEVNGYEVFEELRKNPITKDKPFIFVTASVEKKEVEAALTLGVNAYLKKPYDSEDLIRTINVFLKD